MSHKENKAESKVRKFWSSKRTEETPDQFASLSDGDLIRSLIELKARHLDKELKPPVKRNIIQCGYDFIKKNVGWVLTSGILLTGVANPVANYIGTQRKAQLVVINESLLPILDIKPDSAVNIKTSQITALAAMDPAVIAPVLMNRVNENALHHETGLQILTLMYSLNRQMPNYTWSDKFLFFFVKTNADILDDEITRYSSKAFQKNVEDNPYMVKFYVDLFERVREINPAFNVDVPLAYLSKGCVSNEKLRACKDAKKKFPNNFK
jgi:hypothetical protein